MQAPPIKNFFTSDWHLGHAKVIEFDQRPFKDLEHMHRVLINNYNATVSSGDVCYFLGDMGFTSNLSEILSELSGIKVLILGNHDKGAAAMKRTGFDAVLNSGSLIIGRQVVTMTHCPLRGVWREDCSQMSGYQSGEGWHREFKHVDFSIPNWGQFHLHGHTHKKPEERMLDRQFDVGVRANGYRPVSTSTIESWIAKTIKT